MPDTMTTTQSAFLAAVIANRADDTPRLAYADWLNDNADTMRCGNCKGEGWSYDDHGGNIGVQDHCRTCRGTGSVSNGFAARAEFIRVQCELAKWPCECDSEERVYYEEECRCNEKYVLLRRERELLENNRVHWAQPIPTILHLSAWKNDTREWAWTFHRGFVSSVTLSWAYWRTHHAALLAACPLESVTFSVWPRAEATDELTLLWMVRMNIDPMRQGVAGKLLTDLLRDLWPTVREWRLPGVLADGRPA